MYYKYLRIIPLLLFNIILFIRINKNIKDIILTADLFIVLLIVPPVFRSIAYICLFLYILINYKKTLNLIKKDIIIFTTVLAGIIYLYIYYEIIASIPEVVKGRLNPYFRLIFLYLLLAFLAVKLIHEIFIKKIKSK